MSEEKKLSKMNSAIPQLMRVDTLWQKTHDVALDISYPQWNEYLDRIWLEFEDDASDGVKDEIKEINDKIDKIFLYGLNSKLKKVNSELYSKVVKIQKKTLMAKEKIIRRLQNESGKGSAYQESIAEYMD